MADPSRRLTLVVGEEGLLVDRAVARVIDPVRAADPSAEVLDVALSDVDPQALPELLSPSLFGGQRCIVLRGADAVGKDLAAVLARTLPAVSDAVVVVTSAGGARGKALLDELTRSGAEVKRCEKPVTAADRVSFVVAEFAAAGRDVAPGAATALLATVGTDLRELAAVVSQLVADTEVDPGTGEDPDAPAGRGSRIDEATIARYFRGRAEASGFTVADRTVEGDLPGAVEVLRWALDTGLAPVLVTSSLAANLRMIARVAGEGRSSANKIARTLGQPSWKVDKALRWSRRWSPQSLSAAVRAVAVADAEVKGAAVDAGYAVERAVREVAELPAAVGTSRR